MKVGMATAAVLLATMAIGSGTAAAATKLCPTNSSPSACPSPYPAGTHYTGTGSANFSFATNCATGGIKFETGAVSGMPLTPKITSLTFGSCSNSCTVVAKSLNWMMPIEVSGTGPNGTGKMLSGSGGAPQFEITCAGNPCLYTASVPEFITGGSPAIFKSSGGALTLVSGSGCTTPLSLSMVHEVPGPEKGSGLFVTT